MDMSLPAPKLFVAELQAAVHRGDFIYIGELKFQRVWLQGILVTPLEHGTMVLDDGSDVIDLFLKKEHQNQLWEPGQCVDQDMRCGMHVIVNGRYCEDTVPFIEVHKIVNLSSTPNREALWNLEVAEVHDTFYETLMIGR